MDRESAGHINVTLKFCPECNNILYSREHRATKRLIFLCRTCLYQKETNASHSCVYVNNIKHEVNELAHINSEMIADPTLARTQLHPCPKCKHNEAVFMQGLLTKSVDAMRLYYICTNNNCRFKWTE
ncbi:unnamed protein product [Medioppia subpectinata]|uniref:DNA-directed RNA polymerase subunit n=1 Tax=Medioppia subpectinata TaxID=1979941 RepID=A0A7R9Q3A0_9ACAR|nr:unnamed protein product [Medioppia subpectinata]CAG2111096.1 unnamed protein product [Medioppia subpectinata]